MSLNSEVDMEEDYSRDAQPHMIFYDCETTGFSIYNIGAGVAASDSPWPSPTYSHCKK